MNQQNGDTTIYVVGHKPFAMPKVSGYQPIQVNAAKNPHFCSCTDDTGEQISIKNDRFCELTAMYWMWKNDHHSQYVGLCHYRRYFKFSNQFSDYWKSQYNVDTISKNDIEINSKIAMNLKKGRILIPKAVFFRRKKLPYSVYRQYCTSHNEEDLMVLKRTLLSLYPEYEQSWCYIMRRPFLHPYNMFVMPKKKFDLYAAWLFHVLFAVEKQIPPKKDGYQNRTFGFMGERLFNVYLHHAQWDTQSVPILFVRE